MNSESNPNTFNPAWDEKAVRESKRTRRGMLAVMQKLEAALARATHQRESSWRTDVLRMLSDLRDALVNQAAELKGESGLMAELILETPRLTPRIEELQRRHAELVARIERLKLEISDDSSAGRQPDVADIRSRVAGLIGQIREFQSIETDLIYEATQVDIGVGD